MLELHFIRTMLDILDFNIIFQGEKEDFYTMEFIGVSTMTIIRVLRDFYQPTLPQKSVLPKVLCFDEFKSGSFAEGAMSCILMDGKTGKLVDILENRQKKKLETYFQRYSLENRAQVQLVVTDFYSPYI